VQSVKSLKIQMFMPTVSGKERSQRPVINDSSAELKFIADLGRSLLFTVHPKKVANKVADAIRLASGCDVCAFVAQLDKIGLVSCAFDANGEVEASFLHRERFERWLDFLPPQIGYTLDAERDFLLTSIDHSFEYISPLHINGEVKGVIIAGFASDDVFTERTERVIDAAAQVAAMSINLTAHYESTIDTSISQAKEEHRKFTEAILDA